MKDFTKLRKTNTINRDRNRIRIINEVFPSDEILKKLGVYEHKDKIKTHIESEVCKITKTSHIGGLVHALLLSYMRSKLHKPMPLKLYLKLAEFNYSDWKTGNKTLKENDYNICNITKPCFNHIGLFESFGDKLKLSKKTQEKAMDVYGNFNRKNTSGKNPVNLIAASLRIASVLTGEPSTMREISETFGITDVTLRNNVNTISQVLKD